jgi:PAS domain S-box-containing protein
MKDQQKTKTELIAELSELRQTATLLQTRLSILELESESANANQQTQLGLLKEPHFRAMLEHIGLIAVTLNTEGKIIFCNEFLLNLTGWSRDDAMGQDWFFMFLPPEIQKSLKHDIFLQTVRAGLFPMQYQNEIVTRQGERRLIAWHNTAYHNAQGQIIGVTSLGEDITERVQMEESLRQSEQRHKQFYQMFRLMADNVPDLIWAKDMEKRFIFTNKAMCEKLLNAADTAEPIGKTDIFFAKREREFHPENPDWHTFGEICADSDTVVMESKQPQRFEEFGNVKGEFLFLDVHKAPFRDEQGQMIGTVGSGRDVTREKEIEKTLVEERKLLRTVIDNLPIHIYVKDTESRFLLSNICHSHYWGQDNPGTLLGQTDFDFYQPAMAQNFRADDRQVFITGQPIINREEKSMGADGVPRYFLTTKVPLSDRDGNIIGLVGTGSDITALKQAEQSLRLSSQRLQILHEIDQAILAAQSPQAIAGAALSRLRQIIPCHRASVIEYLKEGQQYHILAVDVDGKTSLEAGKIFDSNPVILPKLQQGQICWVENSSDRQRMTETHQTLLDEGIRLFVVIPLQIQGKLIGALQLATDTPNDFSDNQIEIAREVADSLAVAIAQANLNAQIREDAETKETLLREVNHRVHNNLATIISLLNMEQNRSVVDSQEAHRAKITELGNRVRGLAAVHRMLSDTMWAPLLLHELAEKIIKLGIDIISPRKYIITTVTPSSVRVSARLSNTLALIINELVTNSIKYAWAACDHGKIEFNISQNNKQINLQYKDDGQGYGDEVLQNDQYNVGLQLINSLVSHGLQGQFTLFNDNGAGALIQFPLDEK